MSKRIFITGEAEITSLLRDYISARMEADFDIVNGKELSEEDYTRIKKADVIVLLHEIDQCNRADALENLTLTKNIVDNLPIFGRNAHVAYFAPKKNTSDSAEVREIKHQGEYAVQSYSDRTASKVVLYRVPEIYGHYFSSPTLDRLLSERKTKTPDASYELLHCNDFLNEIYRMVNGAPAIAGPGSYAYPRGAYYSTESELLKKFSAFDNMAENEIPDFPSLFERYLYDYYLAKTKQESSCKIQGDAILSSPRFGRVTAIRLSPGETAQISLNELGGMRMLLLCGQIKIGKNNYCADDSIVRISIAQDVSVKNIGESMAVIETWRHTIS